MKFYESAKAELWKRVNTIYGSLFGDHKPARGVIPVGPLHFGYDIEVEVTAARSLEPKET